MIPSFSKLGHTWGRSVRWESDLYYHYEKHSSYWKSKWCMRLDFMLSIRDVSWYNKKKTETATRSKFTIGFNIFVERRLVSVVGNKSKRAGWWTSQLAIWVGLTVSYQPEKGFERIIAYFFMSISSSRISCPSRVMNIKFFKANISPAKEKRNKALSESKLTDLFPMYPLSTPWKDQKTVRFFDVFRV